MDLYPFARWRPEPRVRPSRRAIHHERPPRRPRKRKTPPGGSKRRRDCPAFRCRHRRRSTRPKRRPTRRGAGQDETEPRGARDRSRLTRDPSPTPVRASAPARGSDRDSVEPFCRRHALSVRWKNERQGSDADADAPPTRSTVPTSSSVVSRSRRTPRHGTCTKERANRRHSLRAARVADRRTPKRREDARRRGPRARPRCGRRLRRRRWRDARSSCFSGIPAPSLCRKRAGRREASATPIDDCQRKVPNIDALSPAE